MITTLLVSAWLVGAVAILVSEVRLARGELLALIFWPVTVPLFAARRKVRRFRFTCRDCGLYYGDAEYYANHLKHRTNCPR